MNRYADHGGAKDATVKNVTRLENLHDGAFGVIRGFHAIHRLMKMRVEEFAERIDALSSKTSYILNELLVNELETLAITVIRGLAVGGERVLETVNDGNQALYHAGRVPLGILCAFALDPFAVIIEIGLAPNQGLAEFIEIVREFGQLGVRRGGIRGNAGIFVRARFADLGRVIFFRHRTESPLEYAFQNLFNTSLKSWAT